MKKIDYDYTKSYHGARLSEILKMFLFTAKANKIPLKNCAQML